MRKRLSLAATALVAEKIVQLAAIAAANIVVLRSLGPAEAGFFNAATALLAMALPVTSFGAVPIVGALARTRDRVLERQLVAQAVVYSVGAAVLAATVLVGLAIGMVDPMRSLVLVLGLALFARPLWAVDVWYQSRQQNTTAAVTRTLGIVISAAARIFIATTSGRLDLLAWALVAEHMVIGLVLASVYVGRRGSLKFGRLPKGVKRKLSLVSWPMFLSGMAVILYMRIDQPMILWLSSSSQVSYYAAATNLNDALSFLPTVAFTLVYPILVRIFETKPSHFLILSQKIFACAGAAAYIIAFIGSVIAPILIGILFGEKYHQASFLLQVLLVGLPFVFLGVLQTPWIIIHGLQRYALLNSCLALLLNVSLNIYLIPLYGALGAAATTVLAHAVGGPLGNVLYAKTRPMFRQQMRALNPIYSLKTAYGIVVQVLRRQA